VCDLISVTIIPTVLTSRINVLICVELGVKVWKSRQINTFFTSILLIHSVNIAGFEDISGCTDYNIVQNSVLILFYYF
jgi:hypothetical protein